MAVATTDVSASVFHSIPGRGSSEICFSESREFLLPERPRHADLEGLFVGRASGADC